MRNHTFSFPNLPLQLLALLSLLALLGPTLAMPRPAVAPANLLTTRAGLLPSKVNPNGRPHDRGHRDASSADPASFKGAAEKQRKVRDARKKKHPDPDAPDVDSDRYCAGEMCDQFEQRCLPMKGHEREPNADEDKWWTCCPRDMTVAGYKGDCCKEVDEQGFCLRS